MAQLSDLDRPRLRGLALLVLASGAFAFASCSLFELPGDDDSSDAASDDDDSSDPFGDALPDQPGIVFTVPDGDLAGAYEYLDDPFCGEWDGDTVAWASDGAGLEAGISVVFEAIPQPSDHLVASFEIQWWIDKGSAFGDGSTLCTFDTGPEAWPSTTGVFECSQMQYEPISGDAFTFEITSGAVRCP